MTNSSFKILHCGFDALEVAFMGCLSKETLNYLQEQKDEAKQNQQNVKIKINKFEAYIRPTGTKQTQGYAFVLDTGSMGATWTIKRNTDIREWNLRVSVRSALLASQSLKETEQYIWQELDNMGAKIIKESIGRVDFATDIQMDDFTINPNMFVRHSASITSFTGENGVEERDLMMKGDKYTYIRVGNNPNRSMVIYDKRQDVIRKKLAHWCEIWGFTELEALKDLPPIWRIEARFFKNGLKSWDVTTFEELYKKGSDMFNGIFNDIRYCEERNIANVTRSIIADFWLEVQQYCKNGFDGLLNKAKGYMRNDLKRADMNELARTYEAMAKGVISGMMATFGLPASKESFADFIQKLEVDDEYISKRYKAFFAKKLLISPMGEVLNPA